jgi:hypothetical protein
MSHEQAQFAIAHRAVCFARVAWLIVCALFLAGCASLPEKMEQAKCRIPPHWPHDMPPPANYGFFQTLWHPWPGAEAVPGFTLNRRKKEEKEQEAEQPAGEELPEPTLEAPTGEGMQPGAEIFETPPERALEEMPSEETPRETRPNEPETAPPERLPSDALEPPAEQPPMDAPEMPEAGAEPLAEPTPEQGAFDFDSLPGEEPTGALVPDGMETAGRRSAIPNLLMPENELRHSGQDSTNETETVRRPAPVRGASATERLPARPFRSSSQNKKPGQATGDAALDGPQRLNTQSIEAAKATTASRGSNRPASQWVSARKSGLERSQPQEQTISTAGTLPAVSKPEAGQSKSGVGEASAAGMTKSSAAAGSRADGWQRRTSRTEYPGVQTGHAEPTSQAGAPQAEPEPTGSANPLR